jgi:2'-5' RNA ligase
VTVSAGQFPEVYKTLGIDISSLGCIMLDVKPFEIPKTLNEEDLYFSPTQDFVQGVVVDHKAHVTLLFGLLDSGPKLKDLVDQVLDGWKKPASIKISDIGVFPGKEDDGTEYSCIVAHVDPEGLIEANNRLRLLPHIDTFPEYAAHMTLAYVKASATTEWVEGFDYLRGELVPTTNLNYGK